MATKRLAILGSTGSIGMSTLDVIDRHPERFSVVALAAGRNSARLAEQIAKYRPRYVAVADAATAEKLRHHVRGGVEIGIGEAAITALASLAEVDTVVAAIVGAAGVRSTMAAVSAGKRVALANKESMVVTGPLMQAAAKRSGADILPVDSEHSAVFQSLVGHRFDDVRRVTLTASGGPFRDWTAEALRNVTVEQALHHPNWNMGAKITIDSATLMNKGLELIEARWLFDLRPSQLDVVVHRESIVHALVEYCDGAVVAQLAVPDMRAPIAYALAYPERITSGIPTLNLATAGQLTFTLPDENTFPCLRIARAANAQGGSAPAILNAANEVAVAAFLERQITFVQIPQLIEQVLSQMPSCSQYTLDEILQIDAEARIMAKAQLLSS